MGDDVAQGPLQAPDTQPLVLAHRGLAGPARENTLAAFSAALAAGADGVELDVRRTLDGVLVVHHDAEVPGAGLIAELAAAALPEWVPRLEDALAGCAGAVVDVEVKASPLEPGAEHAVALAAATARAVVRARAQPDPPRAVLVSSFWPAALEAAAAAVPGLATGLLVHPALDAGDALAQAQALGCRVVLPFREQLTRELVDEARTRSLGVWVWTVNSDTDLRSATALGVDAIVTDDVPLARRILAAT